MLNGCSVISALTMYSCTLFAKFCSHLKTHCNLDSPALHLNLLIFALQTTLTTAVCIVEYHSWPELTTGEKSNLGGLYIPYLVFGEPIYVFYYDDFVRILILLYACSSGDGCRHVWEGEEKFGRGRWEQRDVGSSKERLGRQMIC